MRALLYLGRERMPFCSRHTPGASPDAVSASDALTRFVWDWAIGLPFQGSRRAGGCARRLQTVEATVHGEDVIKATRRFLIWQFVKRDERVGFSAESRWILKAHLSHLQLGLFPFTVIPLFTSHLASPAANAFRRVDQRRLYAGSRGRLCHERLPVALCAVERRSCALTTLTKQAFVS